MIHVIPVDQKALADEAHDAGLTVQQLAAVNRNLDIWADWSGRERPEVVSGEGHLAASGSVGWDQIADREERRISDIVSLCVRELPQVERAVIVETYANRQAGAQVWRYRNTPRSPELQQMARASAKYLLYWMMIRRQIIHAGAERSATKGRAFTVPPGSVEKLRGKAGGK